MINKDDEIRNQSKEFIINLVQMVLYGFLLAGICSNCQKDILPGYAEDLSVHRTSFTIPIETHEPLPASKHEFKKNTSFTVAYDVTSRLEQLLLDLKAYHEMTTSIDGYTIQGYNGTNRQLAFQIKDQLCARFNYLHAEVQYKQPNFTVQIGRFLDRLEAYPLYLRIKKFLPQAIIRPTLFPNKAGIFELLEPVEIVDNLFGDETQLYNQETNSVEDLLVDMDKTEEDEVFLDLKS